MSLTDFQNVVLLFSNSSTPNSHASPATVVRNITALSSQIAYEQTISKNLTTLTTSGIQSSIGLIGGLLYVPGLAADPSCDTAQYEYIARNVTRRANLPPSANKLIAIAPWFSVECALAYMSSARLDPVGAFIFYHPDNSTYTPDNANSPDWSLNDGGAWKKAYKFPIYAIPGWDGFVIMRKLSLYSGNISSVPHGSDIQRLYGPNPDDYVKIWTELSVHNTSEMPELWPYILIVIGALLFIVAAVTSAMQYTHRRRRRLLKRRVQCGEVDLEAMGIQRLTVPESHVKSFPIFTYQANPPLSTEAATRNNGALSAAGRGARGQRRRGGLQRGAENRSGVSDVNDPPSIRSQRSTVAGTVNTTATNNQPKCHICLRQFKHRRTVIRELPCGHIYHPECIDEYLTENSSLCPVCKHCMLPRGYSPKITNAMVRRERAIRRLRERVDLGDYDQRSNQTRFMSWAQRMVHPRGLLESRDSAVPLKAVVVHSSQKVPASGDSPADESPLHQTSPESEPAVRPSDTDSSQQSPPQFTRTRGTQPRNQDSRRLPTQTEGDESVDSIPDEQQSPTASTRERMRHIAAENAPIEEMVDERPKWRRMFGKVFTLAPVVGRYRHKQNDVLISGRI